MKRISRGTPYILSAVDIDNMLGALTPRMEELIAAMLEMTIDEWRNQPKRKKVAQLVDHQNRGQFAAAQNASTRALTDWEEAVTAVRPTDVTENRLDRLEMLVADIANRIDGLTARNAKKGA